MAKSDTVSQVGVPVSGWDGAALGDGLGEAAVGLAETLGNGDADGLGDGLTEGDGDGEGLGDGDGQAAIFVVHAPPAAAQQKFVPPQASTRPAWLQTLSLGVPSASAG